MLSSPKKKLLLITKIIIVIFALIGFILISGYIAMFFGFTNTEGIIDNQTKHFIQKNNNQTYEIFPLAHTKEWISFRQAVVKDVPVITQISKETGISPRLLVAILVPEQMRLFYTNRAVFKEFFEPLKILGNQSQFSWGIFGIKDDTARSIESHLVDQQSPYYLGKSFEKSLSFTTQDIDQERFARIVDEHSHLFAYRYTALYIKQIEAQWSKAGYPISDNQAVIATLWNLGFEKSKPHKDALSGGSESEINTNKYSSGELARLFYYSDELIEVFPR